MRAAPGDGHGSPLAARPSATGTERIIALDGYRAVGLLLVMAFHFGVGWLQGGFFGVDLFYVLSGYLITGLLLGEYRRRERIGLGAFWLRRARRLLPALLIVLVVVTLMVRFSEPAGLYPQYRMDALSALFYFSNWWQISASANYFAVAGAVSPLTHTWSLAVEEQFYLVWPLVVLVVMGLSRSFVRGVRALLALSVVGALLSALEMALLYGPTANVTRLYFGTDTHAQSILVGAALACAMTLIKRRRGGEGMDPHVRSVGGRLALTVLGVAGLATAVVLSWAFSGSSAFTYRGGFLLVDLAAAAVIVAAVAVPGGALARLLALRPLVWLGTVSYGAYLWHYPVFVYLDASRTGQTGLSLLAVRFAVTLALAAASFYLVERPVMFGTFWRSLKAAVPAIGLMLATTSVILIGTLSEASGTSSGPVVVNHAAAAGGKHAIPVLVAGDSTALTLGLALGNAAEEARFGVDSINVGVEGCGIAEGRFLESGGVSTAVPATCNPGTPVEGQWPAQLKDDLHRYRPRVVVLLAGYWEVWDRTDLAGRITNITHPSYARYVEAQLQRFVSIASSTGSRVVLMTAPFYDVGELPDGQSPPQNDPARVRDYNRLVRDVAKRDPRRVTLVGLNRIVCPEGRFTTTIGSITVRAPDGIHFPFNLPYENVPDTLIQANDFARWLDPKLYPSIIEAARGAVPTP